MVNIPSFLEQENNSIKEDASLNAFKTHQRYRTNKKPSQTKSAQPDLFCRVCMIARLPKEIYTSHDPGDEKCTSLSSTDKKRLSKALLSNIKEVPKVAENDALKCGYIKPVPSQILTVFQDPSNKLPVHIDLDSGATVSYCIESEARKRGFKIHPNSQMSKLGDGVTKLKGVGEIHETFFRNNWSVKYSAIVVKDLTSPFIGGLTFQKDNGIQQDIVRNVISIHDKQVTVQSTDPISLLSTAPLVSSHHKVKPKSPQTQSSLSFKSSVLLPGQDVHLTVELEDGVEICVEPGAQSNKSWPESQYQTVKNGKITLRNSTTEPIFLGKEVKNCQIRDTEVPKNQDSNYYVFKPDKDEQPSSMESISKIDLKNVVSETALQKVLKTHDDFQDVFDQDLTQGYNGFFGKHECKLNWATSERPLANKVNVPSYNHELKYLQQELMDELTRQGVLLIPQDHDINVQSVCPSFIQRKQRARDKPKSQLNK